MWNVNKSTRHDYKATKNIWVPNRNWSCDFESADPNSMQDAYHIWTQLNDIALHESHTCSSVDRASALNSCPTLKLLSHMCVMLINSPFLYKKMMAIWTSFTSKTCSIKAEKLLKVASSVVITAYFVMSNQDRVSLTM